MTDLADYALMLSLLTVFGLGLGLTLWIIWFAILWLAEFTLSFWPTITDEDYDDPHPPL